MTIKTIMAEGIFYNHPNPKVNELWVGSSRLQLGNRVLSDDEMHTIVLHRRLHEAGVQDCRIHTGNELYDEVAAKWQALKTTLEADAGISIREYR